MFGKKKVSTQQQQLDLLLHSRPMEEAVAAQQAARRQQEDEAYERRRQEESKRITRAADNLAVRTYGIPGITPTLPIGSSFGDKDTIEKILTTGVEQEQLWWKKIPEEGARRAQTAAADRPVYTLEDANRALQKHHSLAENVTKFLYTIYQCLLYGLPVPEKFLSGKGCARDNSIASTNDSWNTNNWESRNAWEQSAIWLDNSYCPQGIQILWKTPGQKERAVVFYGLTSSLEDKWHIGFGVDSGTWRDWIQMLSYNPEENKISDIPHCSYLSESEMADTLIEAIPRLYDFFDDIYRWLNHCLSIE
jgi:hypothetical protein